MNDKNMSGEMVGKKITGENRNNMQVQVPKRRAKQAERAGSERKRFPIGWLLPVVALGFFLGHFWSYVPVVRGIVPLLVFSKFFGGLSGTHFLL